MKNRTKKKSNRIVSISLIAFLGIMLVMTMVSRVLNESKIPIVETKSPKSGFLQLDAIGRGVIEFGILSDARMKKDVFLEEVYYVKGYFFEKEYLTNVSIGDKVSLSIHGMKDTVSGILAAKLYDYKEDRMEVVLFLEEADYTVGAEVEFVLEDARVQADCHIPNDVIYEDSDGSFYVYLLQERESILGNITIAVKTPIHIIAQNETRAAIEEEFETNTKIIAKNEKLEDGLKVREKEW